MSDDKHSQDTNTLNILHHQLEQSRQERYNSYNLLLITNVSVIINYH